MRVLIAGALVCLALAVVACPRLPSSERAQRTVETQGWTDVREVSRRAAFGALGGCKDSDLALITLRGKNPAGRIATVQVCAPWPFGGYTVRG